VSALHAHGEMPAPDTVVRAFVAVEINEQVRGALAGVQEDLRRTGARVGWVKPEQIHLTLVFLGNVFGMQVRELASAMDAIGSGFGAFEYGVEGIGFFGSPRSPRVIWAGVTGGGERLIVLQSLIAEAARRAGVQLEARAFSPHLTIGRVRSRRGADELTSAASSAKNTPLGTVSVRRVLLMQSHLEHQGVRYTVLHESALKGT